MATLLKLGQSVLESLQYRNTDLKVAQSVLEVLWVRAPGTYITCLKGSRQRIGEVCSIDKYHAYFVVQQDRSTFSTPLNKFAKIAENQARKENSYNETLELCDNILTAYCYEVGRNIPPSSPTPGDAYIIGTTPTQVWQEYANWYVVFNGTTWDGFPPSDKLVVFDVESGAFFTWNINKTPARWTSFVLEYFRTLTDTPGTYDKYKLFYVNGLENKIESDYLRSKVNVDGIGLNEIAIEVGNVGSTKDVEVLLDQESVSIQNPVGTPFEGQKLILRCICNVETTLTFDTTYRGRNNSDLIFVLDENTSGYFIFTYNAQDFTWDLLSEIRGFVNG